MRPRWLAGVMSACAVAQAQPSERVIVVEMAQGPFEAGELARAMRVRLPAKGAEVRVRVTAVEGGVRIEAGRGAREVGLAGLEGAAAARLVALAAGDLVLEDLAVAPVVEVPSTVGILGGAAAWDGLLGNVTVDVAVQRGRWIAALDVGGAALVGGAIDASAAIVRVSGGVRMGWLELRAGGTAAPLIVRSGLGDRTVLVGGGASARVRVPIATGVRGVVAGGVDVFGTRTQYVLEAMTVMATPRWSPWFAAGVEVTP